MQSISQAKMEWMPQVLSWQLLRAESETASQILLTCELAGENKSLLQTYLEHGAIGEYML